jgi:PEP-CTERM motif
MKRRVCLLPIAIAMLLSAHAVGESIQLVGTGKCDDFGLAVCVGQPLSAHLYPDAANQINFAALTIFDAAGINGNLWNGGAGDWMTVAQHESDLDPPEDVVFSIDDIAPTPGVKPMEVETPEPGTLVLLASGMAGAWWKRRRF